MAYLYVGMHDFLLQAKEVVHRVFPGGGSCFSSPCVDCDKRLLYCATLQGIIAALSLVCFVQMYISTVWDMQIKPIVE